MILFVFNIGLALLWATLTGRFSLSNLIFGFIIGYFALLSVSRAIPPSRYFRTAPYLLEFILYLSWEMILASLRVAWEVMTPELRMHPRVLAVPLTVKTDAEIVLLANLVSLTPGSVSLDISSDRTTLYVHAMFASNEEQARRDIQQGFEYRVIRLLRGVERKET